MFEIIKLDFCPLTLMRPTGTPSDRELLETLENITQFIETETRQRRRSVIIVDMSQAVALPASQRRLASKWMKHNNPRLKDLAIGWALIISSPVVRGVVTALFWVTPWEMPYEVFANLDDAVRWAIGRLEAEKISVPERLRAALGKAFDV